MYIGPDTVLPLASAVAAAAGVALIFWRRVVGFVRLALSAVKRKVTRADSRQ
jgi:hypothetical protein